MKNQRIYKDKFGNYLNINTYVIDDEYEEDLIDNVIHKTDVYSKNNYKGLYGVEINDIDFNHILDQQSKLQYGERLLIVNKYYTSPSLGEMIASGDIKRGE